MATSMQYYWHSDLNELLPIWHGNCFKSNPEAVKAYQTDHGEVGVDLIRVETNSCATLTVRYSKQLEQCVQWKHSPLSPYRTAKRVAKFTTPVEKSLSSRWSRIRRTPVKTTEEDGLQLPRYPKHYQGNCLSSCISPDGSVNILLSSYGSHLNKLGIEAIGSKLNSDNSGATVSVTKLSSTRQISQVSCYSVDNKVLCAARLHHSIHVFSASEKDERWQLTEIAAMKENHYGITDSCFSPYIAGEMLYATDDRRLILRDYEKNKDEVAISADCDVADRGFQLRCLFGAHPRCILCMTRQVVHLYDARAPDTRSQCLLQLPCMMIPLDEHIFCSARNPSNSFVQYVATTRTLLTLDERFPKYPVMKWSHLLTVPPSLCYVATLPLQSEKVVLLSNNTTQDTAVIHITQEGQNLRNMHSKGAVKHFPKVSDSLDEYLSCSRDDVAARLSAPLLGLCTVPLMSDDDSKLQLLQMTAAGDIFVQAADCVVGAVEQSDAAVKDEFDERKKWTNWAKEVSHHIDKVNVKYAAPTTANAHSLFEALALEREHLCLCTFCCNCKDRFLDPTTSSNNCCTSCGNQVDRSQLMMSAFKKGSSVTSKPEAEVDLSSLGLPNVDTSLSSDKRTMMILHAWEDDDDDDDDLKNIESIKNNLPLPEDGDVGTWSPQEGDNILSSGVPVDQPDDDSKSVSERIMSQALSPVRPDHDSDFIPSSQQDSQAFVSQRLLKRPLKRDVTLGF